MSDPRDVSALRDELMCLAREDFPRAAAGGDYPVRFDHCFLRIVYDNLLGAPWRTVLPKGQPAIAQLDARQLHDAIAIGHSIVADPETCRRLNVRSLALRGKASR